MLHDVDFIVSLFPSTMCSFFVFLLPLSAVLIHGKIMTKSVVLNSNDESQDGATITRIRDVWSDTTTGEWGLYPHSNDGYQLHLFLDESWSFNATTVTNLSIQIAYNTDNSWYSYSASNDFVMAFSQPNSDSFFAMKMYIDESSEHMIYPQWDTTAPYGFLASGDPAARAYRSLNGWDGVFLKMLDYPTYWSSTTDYFSPIQSDNDRHVESPMTFTLSNVPTSHLQLSYSNPGQDARSCGFNEMSTGTGMNVYFAMNYDQNYDSLNIESISATLSYEMPDETASPTLQPTISPSNVPSRSPTSFPTEFPSEDPTVASSLNPTYAPSNEPSTPPTESTSSPISTLDPNSTKNPAVNPTEFIRSSTPSPTINRISDVPTRNPTARPTLFAIIHKEQQIESTVTTKMNWNLAEIDNQSEDSTSAAADMFVVLTVIAVMMCVGALTCVYIKYRRKKKESMEQETAMEGVINRAMDERIERQEFRISPNTPGSESNEGPEMYAQIDTSNPNQDATSKGPETLIIDCNTPGIGDV